MKRPRIKYKRWKQNNKVSASGEMGGLLRFSALPRGGWFVWAGRPERQQQQRRQPQRQQRLGWAPEIQLHIPLNIDAYLTGGELNPTPKHFSDFLYFGFYFQILLSINTARFF